MKTKRFQQRDNRRVGLLFSSDETYARRMEELTNATSQNTAKRGLRVNRRGQRDQDQAAPETLADFLGGGDVRGNQGEQVGGNSIPEFTTDTDTDTDYAPAADTGCNDDDGLGGADLGWGYVRA